MAERVPALAVWLLRLLSAGETRDRALADLEDVYARHARVRGPAAARRACVREGLLILIWSRIDALRRWTERHPREMDSRRVPMLRDFVQDARHGTRGLRRRPGFTMVVVGVLGLGIGANVAIFTLADRLFLRSPPLVEAPSELVRVFRSWGVPNAGGALSYPDYLDYRDGATTLEGLAASASGPYTATARSGDAPTTVRVLPITANYFDVLGVRPTAGRFLREDENRVVGADPVAIVAWGFAAAQLGGGTANVVGRDLHLNGRRFTVIGVVPRGFRGLGPSDAVPDVYIPMLMRDAIAPSPGTAWRERVGNERERWVNAVGRMRDGVTEAAVRADLAPIAERNRVLGGGDPAEGVLVTRDYRWYPSTGARLAGITRVLAIAVALLLACATANVAILLLARASTRRRELGIRSALGAGRGRVARQMLAESFLLGGAGCIVGIFVAVFAARVAAALLPVAIDIPARPDVRMLAVAVATALSTALLVGLAPAWGGTRGDVLGAIQGRDRHAGGTRLRDALVVVQIALSLVLVAGAAVFTRSLAAARAVDVGFDPSGVLLIGVDLRNHGYDEARGRTWIEQATDRLRALPGADVVTTTRQVPFQGDWSTDLEPWPGARFADARTTLTAGLNAVGTGYFDLMRMPILRGRGFDGSDRADATRTIVVNETFARLAFDGEDALGRTVDTGSGEPWQIVGIVRDALYYAIDEERWPQIYLPAAQVYVPDVTLAVRTAVDPGSLAAPARKALHAIDPDVALVTVETLESVHAAQVSRYRATAHVVGLTGLIALLLASAGLYGVMAFRVSERTREIGLRMALGASRASVARAIVVRGLRLVSIGIVIGTTAALLLGRLVESLLFGVPARDVATLAAAPLILLAVAVGAMLVPARRAMQVDPMRAMRTD